nr:NtaA/DmoA family FMN-dependent monooxygenase [Alysiella crassa]UOP06858.1 NtaA/DmoA family FMN-dependent monooxygenase [Alysiella crassa]
MSKQMLIGLGMTGAFGANQRAWLDPSLDVKTHPDFDADIRAAQLAEQGKFQFLFLGDFPATVPQDNSVVGGMALEPIVASALIAQATSRIGIAATVATSWSIPYTLARQFKTLDVMSGGRMAWNAVTGANPQIAQAFGVMLGDSPSRYEKAYEFTEMVQNLWSSWGETALKTDKSAQIFADYNQVKTIAQKGKHLQSVGALPIPPSKQGQPVIFHSGGSPNNIAYAGRYANVMIGEVWTIEQGQAIRNGLRQSAIDNGRNPDDIKFIAGIMPLIADSKQEALDRHAFFMDEQTLYQRVRHIGAVLGTVFDLDDLDKPIDPAILDKVQITPYSDPRTEIVLKVAREGWTLKEVIHHSVIDYHPASVGTAEDTADFMTEWFNEGACDGFWVLPDVYEVDLKRFVDEVVPILQERGVFHQDYEGDTLREHLGVPYQYGLRK